MADDYLEIPVPAGKLAEVVTYLERREPPERPPPPGPWRLSRRQAPDQGWYLSLYRTVGAEWLWYSRLLAPPEDVARIIADPDVHVFALEREGRDVGLAELSLKAPGEAEICFFGVVASEFGTGAGSWMMSALLTAAWQARPGLKRTWLHTCTFDHPNALPFYLSRGFRAYKRTVGIYSDPRLSGVYGADAAARVPVISERAGDASD